MNPREKAFDWHATFTDLRLAGVTLDEWLTFHRARRSRLTWAQRVAEDRREAECAFREAA